MTSTRLRRSTAAYSRIACAVVAATSILCTAAVAATDAPPQLLAVSPDAPGRPIASRTYKVAFNFNSPSVEGSVNRGLVALGSFGAEYESYGVTQSRRCFVVVLGRAYVDLALTEEAYRKRHDGRSNPDVPVMRDLMGQGVKFVIPLAEAKMAGIVPADLQPGVEVGPSSDFLFINLEAEGYGYTGTKSLEAQYP